MCVRLYSALLITSSIVMNFSARREIFAITLKFFAAINRELLEDMLNHTRALNSPIPQDRTEVCLAPRKSSHASLS